MTKGSIHEQDKYTALDSWFYTPQGLRVAEAFSTELKSVEPMLSGTYLLQLGACGENLWLDALNYQKKWIISPSRQSSNVTLYASINALPIERHSVDCVLAPLTMEAFTPYKHPLHEIDRILKPMGHVIFFGVNPWSFWGFALRFSQLACFNHTPATLHSSLILKRSLLDLGYEQRFLTSFYYILPVASETFIQKMEFLNEVGKMVYPYPPGFYCFIAQKHEICSPDLQTQRSNLCFASA